MAKTAVSDVIVPSIFEGYVIERTAELAVFAQAGIIVQDPVFDQLSSVGGNTVNMPFWQDISGTRQLLSDSGSLSVNKIAAATDIARIQMDAQAWSVNLLAKLLSGDDPMAAIGDLVGQYWARTDEDILVASIKGLFLEFDSIAGDPNILKIASESKAGTTDATRLTGSTFVDALQVLGDRASRLTAIGIHSATEAFLKKADLIDYVPDSEGKASIATFQGRRVVVDDDLTTRAGTTDGLVYTSVLFGEGAFAKGAANLSGEPLKGGFGTEGVEFARVALDSDDVLINRRRFILHPRGVKFDSGSVAGTSPTDAELALAANWTKVYEAKNIRLVIIEHNNTNA
jgi:hypothetical protein